LYYKARFEVVAAKATMTRAAVNNWTTSYVKELENNVKYQICGDIFIKKNERILSHLRYICSTDERDNNVRLCKEHKAKRGVCILWMQWSGSRSTEAYEIAASSR
jgi:hypothetical protein